MNKILIAFLITLCNFSYAEYESLNTLESMDRLEQLSRTLGNGSYTQLDTANITASTSINTSKLERHDTATWNVHCRKDRFNGDKICFLSKYYSGVNVMILNGRYSVYVGKNHYPRSESAIKIDNNAAIYGHEGASKTPLKVIEQMKRGKIAYTRYVEWPYDYNKDDETTLDGFQDAFDEMNKQYKQL